MFLPISRFFPLFFPSSVTNSIIFEMLTHVSNSSPFLFFPFLNKIIFNEIIINLCNTLNNRKRSTKRKQKQFFHSWTARNLTNTKYFWKIHFLGFTCAKFVEISTAKEKNPNRTRTTWWPQRRKKDGLILISNIPNTGHFNHRNFRPELHSDLFSGLNFIK